MKKEESSTHSTTSKETDFPAVSDNESIAPGLGQAKQPKPLRTLNVEQLAQRRRDGGESTLVALMAAAMPSFQV